ncbi:MAG: phosphate-starvation-inducible PsiE family protein [Pleurocapsa sp. MO_192.B19]|nr:phosphate-starvation-inducible PsiE family protein [Pleurocapsa sp. MO_192.B19]
MVSIKSKSNSFDRRFSLNRMFRNLDKLQDVIVFGCGILLVFKMMLILVDMFLGLNQGIDVKSITADSLFLLILVELFRLLAVYLKHHRIYVGIAVEVAVVSVLREIIVEGLIHMEAPLVLATCSFLFVLGALMLVSHKVEGTVDH